MAGRRAMGAVLRNRLVPAPSADSEFFWRSGADGVLRMLRCNECGFISHPPGPRCRSCLSPDVAPAPLSGRASVTTFTVNFQQWQPEQEPYIVARVELVEQDGLRIDTNLVDVDGDDVHLGMPVEVVFEEGPEGFWFPLFRPSESR